MYLFLFLLRLLIYLLLIDLTGPGSLFPAEGWMCEMPSSADVALERRTGLSEDFRHDESALGYLMKFLGLQFFIELVSSPMAYQMKYTYTYLIYIYLMKYLSFNFLLILSRYQLLTNVAKFDNIILK